MEFDARVERCNISRAIRSEVYATYYWKFEREARRVETLTSCSTFTSPSPSRINFTLINPSWESRPCRWKLRNEGRRKININLIQTGRANVQWKIRNFKFHSPPEVARVDVRFGIFPRIITILLPSLRAGTSHTRARSKFITALRFNNKIESLALAMPTVRILRMRSPSVYRVF